jgi:hypothetical protein
MQEREREKTGRWRLFNVRAKTSLIRKERLALQPVGAFPAVRAAGLRMRFTSPFALASRILRHREDPSSSQPAIDKRVRLQGAISSLDLVTADPESNPNTGSASGVYCWL